MSFLSRQNVASEQIYLSIVQAEINYLGRLRHPNLVKLIGYCLEDDHRLLAYEFMPKGSMENHLFRSEYTILSYSFSVSTHSDFYRHYLYLKQEVLISNHFLGVYA